MDNSQNILWYKEFADEWNNAAAIGNGRLGGMVFGKTVDEIVELNEDSIWSGDFRKRENPNALKNLEKVRKLIEDGKVTEAQKIIEEDFYGRNEQQRHYMPLGTLHIQTDCTGEITDYKRVLDMENGVVSVSFLCDGKNHRREYFVSYPDNVMAIKYSCDCKFNMKVFIDGRDDNYDKNEKYDDNTIIFTVSDGVKYAAAIKIISDGKYYADGNFLKAEDSSECIIILSCETSFRSGEYFQKAVSSVENAFRKGYEKLYTRSTEDFNSEYNRVKIKLYDNSDGKSSLPTNERLANIKNGGKDNRLAESYFNFSKYLMISGSRKGSLPLNLQGIWNKDMWPAWGGKYTVNINTEMNYWACLAEGLEDCMMPLFDHIERMRTHGRVTAREMYNCKGTVCHHNTDLWGDTAPQDKWMPATIWPMGLAWLCLNIYEYYKFTLDEEFLREKYDTMCEAAEFFTDYLKYDKHGRLVTSPSVSPENTYVTSTGEKGSICEGPSMDSQILYTLFSDIIESADIIKADNTEFVGKLKEIREKLPKPEIGKYGQIKEWAEDYDEVEIGHRHISQLFALYPGEIITPEDTPKLSEAARATIERRLSHGGGHTGWSRAWIINMWARLEDGEKVGENIEALLSRSTADSMLDMHPPFQIDGNFGGGAGIIEALIQSQRGRIKLIPAIPEEWKKQGSVSGIRARGGFTLDYSWADGNVTNVRIVSRKNTTVKIKGYYYVSESNVPVDSIFENGYTTFKAAEKREYELEKVSG